MGPETYFMSCDPLFYANIHETRRSHVMLIPTRDSAATCEALGHEAALGDASGRVSALVNGELSPATHFPCNTRTIHLSFLAHVKLIRAPIVTPYCCSPAAFPASSPSPSLLSLCLIHIHTQNIANFQRIAFCTRIWQRISSSTARLLLLVA